MSTGLSRQNNANRGLKKIAIVPPMTSGARIMVQRNPPPFEGSGPRLGTAASIVGLGARRRGGRLNAPGEAVSVGVGRTLRTSHTVAPTWSAAPTGQRNRSC